MQFIEVEQIRSPTRRKRKQRRTLEGLGLRRIGQIKWIPDMPQTRGMIQKVAHLVRINHDPAEAKPPQTREYDEAEDAALMQTLLFDPKGIVLHPCSAAELKTGKTPDFKLFKDGKLCGFCEMKSPRDDYVFGPPNEKGFAVRKNLPFYRKLGSHVRHAGKQFEAVNPGHKFPNIMVFINHAPDIERRDLIATIAGLPVTGGPPLFMLGRKMQKRVGDAARNIDLFLWIDAEKGTCQHVSVNEAPHQQAALDLLDLKREASVQDGD